MLDLGTTFVASVARDPDALAVVDGALRLTYARGTSGSQPLWQLLISSTFVPAITW